MPRSSPRWPTPRTVRVIPVLRIFSVEKAREFYLGYAGFRLDWEHRPEPDAPVYLQVSRDGLVLHLSEHYGDGAPGACFHVEFRGVKALHAELTAKKYPYWRPGLTKTFRGRPQLTLVDPFGNKLYLGEPDRPPAPVVRAPPISPSPRGAPARGRRRG